MITVSNAYKMAMDRPLRNRAFISVGIGMINQEAQASAKVDTTKITEYSNPYLLLSNQPVTSEYATFEEHFFKCDGTQLLLPDENIQYARGGIVSTDILGSLRVDLGNTLYWIKGITIDFTDNYPMSFIIKTSEGQKTYFISDGYFYTDDVFETNFVEIVPLLMQNGEQRLRINKFVCGIGLSYTDNDIESAYLDEYCSSISAELPTLEVGVTVIDIENKYNVDNENSALLFLEAKQKITMSFGMTLPDGSVEWINSATGYLDSWDSTNGRMKFKAIGKINFLNEQYSLAGQLYERTAYEEALSIFRDAGLEIDEYYIDEYLRSVTLINPIPKGTHAECLQVLCNATRCILTQNTEGVIEIKANFANVLDSDELQITTNTQTDYSNVANVASGSSVRYADFSEGYINGEMLLLPDDKKNYLPNTGYISDVLANENGEFETIPNITIKLPALYSYYGLHLQFDGKAPTEVKFTVLALGEVIKIFVVKDLEQDAVVVNEFLNFDELKIDFIKGAPNSRIHINKISFGNLSDYKLTRNNMLTEPIGKVEQRIRNVYIKIYSYDFDANDKPVLIDDDNYFCIPLNPTGIDKYCENPLVSDEDMAYTVGRWLGNYYANNVHYNLSYRGEPRLHPTDIIMMESLSAKNNLQTEITDLSLDYDGAFSGKLELRRALKMINE